MFGSVSVIVPFNASEEYGDMNALKIAGLAHASNYTGAHTQANVHHYKLSTGYCCSQRLI